jgi:hypothetical protein
MKGGLRRCRAASTFIPVALLPSNTSGRLVHDQTTAGKVVRCGNIFEEHLHQ